MAVCISLFGKEAARDSLNEATMTQVSTPPFRNTSDQGLVTILYYAPLSLTDTHEFFPVFVCVCACCIQFQSLRDNKRPGLVPLVASMSPATYLVTQIGV